VSDRCRHGWPREGAGPCGLCSSEAIRSEELEAAIEAARRLKPEERANRIERLRGQRGRLTELGRLDRQIGRAMPWMPYEGSD
jgi:hypothetical protein